MLEDLRPQPADKILMLMQMFREDPRDDKIDLGVGVYKDAEGRTPVMAAVKEAERRLVATQDTKSYTGLAGDPAFGAAMVALILGQTVPADRVAFAAQPGGTGAIHQGLELVKLARPQATVWLSDPTWPNHNAIARHLGMAMRDYRYFDAATGTADVGAMLEDLGQTRSGDVVVLHGCCHNPTGANLTLEDWAQVAAVLMRTGATALVDLAYQGFGDGLDNDAAPTRFLAQHLPEVLVAASCSKNFGIYRERTGILLAVAPDAATRDLAQANLATLNRLNFSFPPDHGARVVSTILGDAALRAEWEAELEATRDGLLHLRTHLAEELRKRTNSDRFDFVARHRGMFSRLGLTPAQVERLRTEHGIYMVGDSRINIAGLNTRTVPVLAAAVAQVIG